MFFNAPVGLIIHYKYLYPAAMATGMVHYILTNVQVMGYNLFIPRPWQSGWNWIRNLVLAMENKENERFSSVSDGALIPPRRFRHSWQLELLKHVHTTAAEDPLNLLQKSYPRFRELHNVIDNLYCKLQDQGIGIPTKSAEGGKMIYILCHFS